MLQCLYYGGEVAVIKFPIHHWRNLADDPEWIVKDDKPRQGYACWTYAARSEFALEKWMEDHFQGKFDCTLRFNSGDPMYTVWIEDERDATLFCLTFM